MGTGGGDAAFFQDQDEVGGADGAEPLGDDEAGAPAHQALQRQLDEVLGFGIYAGERIIEDEDARILEQGAGDGDALLLSAGERHAALADMGGIALRQFQDEVVGLRRFCCGENLFVAGVGAPKSQVLADARGEERGFLQYDADLIPQRFECDAAQIVAIYGDAARRGIVETRQQVDDRTFAGAGRAEQGDHLPRLRLEADVGEHLVPPEVGERDILEADVSLHGRQFDGVGRVAHLRFGVEDLEDALARSDGLHHGGQNHPQTADGLHELAQVRGEGNHRAEGELPTNDQRPAIPEDQHGSHVG